MHRLAWLAGTILLAASTAAHASGSWRIVKDHWSDADERGYSQFVGALGETNCNSAESCLQSAANPYRSVSPLPGIHVDCAKLPYLLRAYYAWNNGLPFSYISVVHGEGGDLRFTSTSNIAVSRMDLVDTGNGIDAPNAIRTMLANVFTGMFRFDPRERTSLVSDFYSPAVQRGSIRPGTNLYDVHGHVMVVYKVDAGGRVYYMDGNPDLRVTRGAYGPQLGRPPIQLGGGFKNWRPFQLVGGARDPQGHLIGGHMVFTHNSQIADYSLVQYTGNANPGETDTRKAQFVYNGIPVGPFEYVRVALSNGETRDAPVYALRAAMRTLCNDFQHRREESWRTRISAEAAQFHDQLAGAIRLWINRDPRIAYDGEFLKSDLAKAYDEESRACAAVPGSRTGPSVFADLARALTHDNAEKNDLKSLIDNVGAQVAFRGMAPVGN
jgi:hypothetical protein